MSSQSLSLQRQPCLERAWVHFPAALAGAAQSRVSFDSHQREDTIIPISQMKLGKSPKVTESSVSPWWSEPCPSGVSAWDLPTPLPALHLETFASHPAGAPGCSSATSTFPFAFPVHCPSLRPCNLMLPDEPTHPAELTLTKATGTARQSLCFSPHPPYVLSGIAHFCSVLIPLWIMSGHLRVPADLGSNASSGQEQRESTLYSRPHRGE